MAEATRNAGSLIGVNSSSENEYQYVHAMPLPNPVPPKRAMRPSDTSVDSSSVTCAMRSPAANKALLVAAFVSNGDVSNQDWYVEVMSLGVMNELAAAGSTCSSRDIPNFRSDERSRLRVHTACLRAIGGSVCSRDLDLGKPRPKEPTKCNSPYACTTVAATTVGINHC